MILPSWIQIKCLCPRALRHPYHWRLVGHGELGTEVLEARAMVGEGGARCTEANGKAAAWSKGSVEVELATVCEVVPPRVPAKS